MRLGRELLCLTLAIVASLTSAMKSAAQDDGWPTKQTLRIVVPYAAGSNGDAVGRIIAAYLGRSLKGSTTVVDNRPGIGGILGTRSFTKSPPDGYTLCVCSGGAITVPSTVDKGYDPLVDLLPISKINTSPLVLMVNANSSMKSVADVVGLSKKKSGGLNYGSSGAGGLMYNSAEVFKSRTGSDFTHVPFRGGPDAMTALMAGEIDLVFAIMSDVTGQLGGGKLRPIAISTSSRSPIIPDVPTMIEAGVKGYDISLWNGLFAPANTPQSIVGRLSEIMLRMPKDETVQKIMTASGQIIEVNTPDQFRKELREESALWEEGLKDVIRK
jgi:tripartite-type tricarboxylate transporter receptor subunit TctC